jgi:ubiquinone/menaquinone biosynthesis C-methylase UbiE
VATTKILDQTFVEETRFGTWFIGTELWRVHVLRRALNDLERLMAPRRDRYPAILDVGFGHGHALVELDHRFRPTYLVGLDPDPETVDRARAAASACEVTPELLTRSASDTRLASEAFDLIFCHQTFHHIVDQDAAMSELFRVLRPGGVLLFAESTKKYIESWLIRWLFRHPMHVQKTAEEYIGLIRSFGFDVAPERISLPFLWWSRWDLGTLEWLGVPVPDDREETLVNLVAVKPA